MMYTKEELERFDEILDGGFTRVVVVRHENGMKCLFKVPDGVKLKPDDMVICETFKGEPKGGLCYARATLRQICAGCMDHCYGRDIAA